MRNLLLTFLGLMLFGCGDNVQPTPTAAPAAPSWQKHTPSPEGSEARFVMYDGWRPTGDSGEPSQRGLYRLDTWTGRAWRLERLDPKVSDDLARDVWETVMEDDDAFVRAYTKNLLSEEEVSPNKKPATAK